VKTARSCISGAVSAGVIALLMIFGTGLLQARAAAKILSTAMEKEEEPGRDLATEDLDPQPDLEAQPPANDSDVIYSFTGRSGATRSQLLSSHGSVP
jgi:hypothetical protein